MTEVDPRVATFYTDPNEIDVGSIRGDAGELLRALVSRLVEGKRTLMPARVDRQTRWYGIAGSDRDLRVLLEEFSSWLGPPLCDAPSIVQTPEDVIDERAAALTADGTILRANVGEEWQTEARENVRSLLDAWTLAPQSSPDLPRPVGRVLRQFYESISARDRTAAAIALEELQTAALLSPTNIRFLRVELIAHLGRPEELRDDPLLAEISLLRRPPTVTDHLARAADALLVPPTAAGLGIEALRTIAEEIEGTWPGLVTHPSQVRSHSGARCLALSELLAQSPRRSSVHTLRSDWIDDALVSRVVSALEDKLEPVPGDSVASEAAQSPLGYYQRGEFEMVIDTAERHEPDRSIATAAMHAALNLGDATAAARALAIVDRLPERDRSTLLSQAVEGAFHAKLISRNQGTQVPDSWVDWLRGDWPDRPDLLHDWCADWSTDTLLVDQAADKLASELLDALHDGRRGRVRNGLPALVRWLTPDDGLLPSSIPLAVTIFEIMLGSDPGRAERRAALELLNEILLTGCSADEYRSVIVALRDQLAHLGPQEVDWLTGVLDALLLNTAPQIHPRDELFGDGLGLAVSWYGRIDETELTLLRSLFADVDLQFGPPAPDTTDANPIPNIRPFNRVGIYSLSESAAANAGRWICDEWPEVEVRLSHAHTNTLELEGFVRTSDVILMQTSHAKHAATTAIERLTEPSRLVRVNGRGATSLFRGLLEWASFSG